MKKQMVIYTMCATAFLSSCHIYKSYDRPEDIHSPETYRDTASTVSPLSADTATIGNLPWREVFTDPFLQVLIEEGLTNNTDLQTALLNVKQSEALLTSSKLAFLPSLGLSPQGTISSFDHGKATKTYQLPVVASWEVDIFGNLLNAKRSAKATLEKSEAYRQAVQTQLVAAIANYYYTLLMLDKQLAITEETAVKWKENVETMKSMKEAAMTNEAAVVQSEATYYQVCATLPDLRRSIREAENALSLLLGKAPQQILRGNLADQSLPSDLSTGIPLQLLSNRPDVRVAEKALAETYYSTNQARAAFYPSIRIDGSAGWTNSAGSVILNPAKFLASAIGSLTQPLFYRGANIARLKVAKAQQEQAKLSFQQTILNASGEVSDALYMYQTASEKSDVRKKQIDALEKSVEYTADLFMLGSSTTYLEILNAEQSLLSARLSEVSDSFTKMQAVVNLYHALGGGRE